MKMSDNILEKAAISKINNGLKKLDKNPDEALKILEEAKSLCAKFDPEQKHPTTASVLVGIGTVYQKQDKDELAIRTYEQALSIRDNFYKEEIRSETASLLTIVAELCEKTGQKYCTKSSFNYYDRALGIKEQLYGKDNVDALNIHVKLGAALLAQEKHEEYIPHFEAYIEHIKKTDANRAIVANVEYALGVGYNARKVADKSIEYFRESLADWKLLNDSKHIIETANVLAKIYMDSGNSYDAAETFITSLDEQLHLLKNAPVSNEASLQKASLVVKKGNAYQAKGEYRNSIEHYKEALKLYPDKTHADVSDTLYKIAEEYTKLGDIEASECYNGLLVKLAEGNDVELFGECDNKAITACAEQEL